MTGCGHASNYLNSAAVCIDSYHVTFLAHMSSVLS